MIWGICFCFAVAFIAAGLVAFLFKRSQGKKAVGYLGAGVFLASVSVCFPVMYLSDQAGFAVAMSISQSIRMFVVDTGVSDVLDFLSPDVLGILFYPYKVLICLLYLLAPVFTLSFVLQYFSNCFEHFRLMFRGKQNLYVFSDLNDRSLEIATGLYQASKESGRKIGIIFCRSSEKDNLNIELEENAKELNAVFIAGEMQHLRLNNKKRYIAYFHISDDDEKNIDNTLLMIDNMTSGSSWVDSGKLNQRNTAVYCYAAGAEAEILLDAKEKEDLRIVLMDEVRDAVYEQLYKYPLYSGINIPVNQSDKKQDVGEQCCKEMLSLLIVGGGRVGQEFLKAAVWCGQMKNFEFNIYMIDLKGNLIRKKMKEECPELFKEGAGYNIDIYKANVFSNVTEEYLNRIGDISYCVVCLGEDEDNIRAAIFLKKYFYMKKTGLQPLICTHITSSRKRVALWNLHENTRSGEKLYYDIIPFGNRRMYFENHSDAAFILEYLGLGVQAHYWRLNRDSGKEERRNAIKNFYEKQSNRRSSIANGLHINSKLWELGLGIMRVPHDKKQKELFEKHIHPVEFKEVVKGKIESYYNVEHERWMAYVRAEGWRLASKGDDTLADIRQCYEEYCTEFKNQNYMMKLHPALVPIHQKKSGMATLQEVDYMIAEVNREKGMKEYFPDYVQSDKEVVNHIGDIVGGAWCGKEGISIHGILAEEGECVICKLADMLAYYMHVYDEYKLTLSPEEIMAIRSEIKRCRCGLWRVECT
ncbi:MAG TPA: hypothetical protein H9730_00760 [Candidatus Mediterraneibacter stercoripullorum]|nr:hypothetical protein [Candidatus Mediterraneibacter stercoripullorum]